jgi:16S rRNA processing protein RimM
MLPGHVAVARVRTPHGLRGEVKVQPLTEDAAHFAPGRRLWAGEATYEVEASRPQKGLLLLRLIDVTTVEAAKKLRGCLLSLPESELARLPEGEYYAYQLIGLDVYDDKGGHLGKVAAVLPTGSNDVYVVEGARGELLLPAIDDVIVEVDMAGRRMVVSLMDGMLSE